MDARSDLYSVGIMLFQLVTGRLPFDADSPLAIAYAHVQEEPVAASQINRSLPPAVDALIARALKKNPNERFPSAEAMRTECLRVAASFQAAAPSIVPGAQTSSGAGVGSAVFPPVDQGTAAPAGPVQTPYQPTPTPNPYGTPPPSPAYGYPQQGGYQAPTPAPNAYASTPPPYNIAPHQAPPAGGGGRKNNKPVILGSIIVSVVAVGGLIAALALNGGGTDDDAGGDTTPTTSSTPSGYRTGDANRTVETTECTEPQESNNDPDQVQMPDFAFKNWDSVKLCMQAAGWSYDDRDYAENTYGQGTIMNQFPKAGTDFDPKNPPDMQFDVSTGVSAG